MGSMSQSEHVTHYTRLSLPILRKYGARRAGFFGSITREDFSPESDIDMLIEFRDQDASQNYFDLKFELEAILKRSVDLVEYDRLKPIIKFDVLKQEIPIL